MSTNSLLSMLDELDGIVASFEGFRVLDNVVFTSPERPRATRGYVLDFRAGGFLLIQVYGEDVQVRRGCDGSKDRQRGTTGASCSSSSSSPAIVPRQSRGRST